MPPDRVVIPQKNPAISLSFDRKIVNWRGNYKLHVQVGNNVIQEVTLLHFARNRTLVDRHFRGPTSF